MTIAMMMVVMMMTLTICDLCIKESVVFQRRRGIQAYCVLEQNVDGLNGKYRLLSGEDEEDYNYVCNYKRGRQEDKKR